MSPIFRKSKPPLFSETNLIYRSTGKKAESENLYRAQQSSWKGYEKEAMCPCSKCTEKSPHPEFFGKPLYTRPAWFILSLSKDTWCFDRLNRTVRGDALHCAEALEASLSKCSPLGKSA